jgi:hypothetical protein
MKDKALKDLEWKVLIEIWHNGTEIEHYNIFNNSNIARGLSKLIKNYTTFDNFKEELTTLLKYSFMSKREYEIFIPINGDKYNKIDMWEDQLKPHLEMLAYYIVREYNKHKRKKLDIGDDKE